MAGQFPVDDEALSHASSGLSLSSLVDVDVLYFDGTIPTVFLTDSEVSIALLVHRFASTSARPCFGSKVSRH